MKSPGRAAGSARDAGGTGRFELLEAFSFVTE